MRFFVVLIPILLFGVVVHSQTLPDEDDDAASLTTSDANYTQLMEGVDGLRHFLTKRQTSQKHEGLALSKSLHLLEELDEFASKSEDLHEMMALFQAHTEASPPILKAGVAAVQDGLIRAQQLAGQVLLDLVETLQEHGAEMPQRDLRVDEVWTLEGSSEEPREDPSDDNPTIQEEKVVVSPTGKTTASKTVDQHLAKLQGNPKIRQHLRLQEALRSGDLSVIHRRVDGIHRRMTGRGLAEAQMARHLQAEDQWEESCDRLVECVREYTLYDVLVYFYGPYINDDGEIDDGFPKDFLNNIWSIVENVHEVLKKFEPTPSETENYGGQCSKLLQLFHRNEKMDGFVQYHPATWREVCRAEGATKYVKFDEIKDKLGTDVADQVFDDLARCATNLGENLFFAKSGVPRVPTKVADVDESGKSASRDIHGKAIIPTKSRTYFKMQYLSVLGAAEAKMVNITVEQERIEGPLGPHRESWGKLQKGFRSNPNSTEKCMDLVNQHYRDVLLNASPNVFITKKRLYPRLTIRCQREEKNRQLWFSNPFGGTRTGSRGRMSGRSNPAYDVEYHCDVLAGEEKICNGARFVNPEVCPASSLPISRQHTCTKGSHYELQTIFRAADDRDKAASLALGEKASVGLVCAYAETTKETAGYCCLDAPYERSDDAWGSEFSCDLGESACLNKAPELAGFSEGSCDVYSGKWCPHPRDCSVLKGCIAREVEWAEEQRKNAYYTYLIDSPQIKDAMSHDQCGSVREYFGNDADYPDDEEICEDVQLLRHNKGFDELDENFSGSRSPDENEPENIAIGDEADLADSAEANLADADGVSEGGRTPQMQEPTSLVKKAALDSIALSIYQWAQSENAIEEASDIIGGFECPEDLSGIVKSACAVVKNAAFLISSSAVFACERIFGAMVQNEPGMTEYEHFEVRAHAMKVVDNMRILNDGVSQLKAQNAKNSRVVISANEVNTKAIIDASSTNSRAILDVAGDLGDLIQNTCKSGRDLELRSSDPIECEEGERVVSCWFDSPQASVDGKTLFIEEGVRKVDTGIRYKIEDPCSDGDAVDVQVSVVSNELEEKPTAVLAKHRDNHYSEQPRIYVKPAKCPEDSVDFCVSDSSSMRFYEIEISAGTSLDTCRLIVTPIVTPTEAGELRGNASRRPNPAEEEALVQASSNRFIIGEISLRTKVESRGV